MNIQFCCGRFISALYSVEQTSLELAFTRTAACPIFT